MNEKCLFIVSLSLWYRRKMRPARKKTRQKTGGFACPCRLGMSQYAARFCNRLVTLCRGAPGSPACPLEGDYLPARV